MDFSAYLASLFICRQISLLGTQHLGGLGDGFPLSSALSEFADKLPYLDSFPSRLPLTPS